MAKCSWIDRDTREQLEAGSVGTAGWHVTIFRISIWECRMKRQLYNERGHGCALTDLSAAVVVQVPALLVSLCISESVCTACF